MQYKNNDFRAVKDNIDMIARVRKSGFNLLLSLIRPETWKKILPSKADFFQTFLRIQQILQRVPNNNIIKYKKPKSFFKYNSKKEKMISRDPAELKYFQ